MVICPMKLRIVTIARPRCAWWGAHSGYILIRIRIRIHRQDGSVWARDRDIHGNRAATWDLLCLAGTQCGTAGRRHCWLPSSISVFGCRPTADAIIPGASGSTTLSVENLFVNLEWPEIFQIPFVFNQSERTTLIFLRNYFSARGESPCNLASPFKLSSFVGQLRCCFSQVFVNWNIFKRFVVFEVLAHFIEFSRGLYPMDFTRTGRSLPSCGLPTLWDFEISQGSILTFRLFARSSMSWSVFSSGVSIHAGLAILSAFLRVYCCKSASSWHVYMHC